MARPDFEVDLIKKLVLLEPFSADCCCSSAQSPIMSISIGIFYGRKQLVKSRSIGLELRVHCLSILIVWDFCKLVFHNCIHISDNEENPASELVLVIDSKPPVEQCGDFRLEDLSDGQFMKRLLVENFEVLLRLRNISKVLTIGCLDINSSEKFAWISSFWYIKWYVNGCYIRRIWSTPFETFQSFHIYD